MSEEVEPVLPPPGWHPDPSGTGQLRYWDGAAWTSHVAPDPAVAGATAQPAPAPQGSGLPAAAAPRTRTSRATWVVLALTAIVVAAAIGGTAWGATSAAAQIEGEASAQLDAFLASASVGDASWREHASPGLVARIPSSPLVGEPAAARSIELAVSYDRKELMFGKRGSVYTEKPAGTDAARAVVDLTYTFTADGEKQTATVSQAVWLTRPFYYGSDKPSAVRDGERPTAVGPWRVSGLGNPASVGFTPPQPTSTYTAKQQAKNCEDGTAIMVKISAVARTQGFIAAVCLSEGTTTNIGEDVDLNALAAGFPVLPDVRQLPEELALYSQYRTPSPLQEYRVSSAGTDYIFVLAAAGGGALDDTSDYRVISLQRAEGQ